MAFTTAGIIDLTTGCCYRDIVIYYLERTILHQW